MRHSNGNRVASRNGEWFTFIRGYLIWTAVAHLSWEFIQLPLFTIWEDQPLRTNLLAVLHCTVGDVLIALSSLMLCVAAAGTRLWPSQRHGVVAVLTTVSGATYTVYSEWVNTTIRLSWSYGDAMPMVPGIGTGLTPFLQWMVLPPLGLWLCRRLYVLPR